MKGICIAINKGITNKDIKSHCFRICIEAHGLHKEICILTILGPQPTQKLLLNINNTIIFLVTNFDTVDCCNCRAATDRSDVRLNNDGNPQNPPTEMSVNQRIALNPGPFKYLRIAIITVRVLYIIGYSINLARFVHHAISLLF